ncbi:MAG: 3-keto-disaccharide hydrolase [Planctomycetota bacterium]
MRSQVFTRRAALIAALLSAGILVRAASAAETGPNTLTPEEKAAGFKLLFDGKTTDGWRNYKKDTISSGWKVVDGALVRAEKGAGDILTKDKYGSFELLIDYKISEGGNSGIMFHVTEEGNTPWQTGPEIQIQDNVKGHDPQKSGWLYQFYTADEDATKPAGEWNTLRIVISPEKCEHYMNGVKYFEYVKGSEDWNKRLADSKFAKFPAFGKADTGYICLQDHGNEVAFRNIKIRELPAK